MSLQGSKACYYVGLTIKLASRISSHKYRITYFNKYKNTGSPIFYRTVLNHNWSYFKFGILKYLDLSSITVVEEKKKSHIKKRTVLPR